MKEIKNIQERIFQMGNRKPRFSKLNYSKDEFYKHVEKIHNHITKQGLTTIENTSIIDGSE